MTDPVPNPLQGARFWRAATAFFDALSLDGLALDAGAKPLLAKVDQQVKQLIEGSAKVPERLFRDLLLQVVFHARIAAEHPTDPFTVDDVAAELRSEA